jgi:hypothetical protein
MAPVSIKVVAGSQLIVALLLLIGIWVGLPARDAWVDAAGTLLAALYLASACGLFLDTAWGRKLALFVCWSGLIAGCCTVTALAMSVAHLVGQYGPVGAGGALLMGTIAALVLPYLVFLPALQLAWLRQRR